MSSGIGREIVKMATSVNWNRLMCRTQMEKHRKNNYFEDDIESLCVSGEVSSSAHTLFLT